MIIWITGTDTGVGKSYATGLLARAALERGLKVITQKPVQTGTKDPEDLILHRHFMGLDPDPPELLRFTNPYLFSYPAAPATAAAKENKKVNLLYLKKVLENLQEEYDLVLVEGAGGIYVPLTETETFLDLFQLIPAPVVVVSLARLGTINHTILTVKTLEQHSLKVVGLVYNLCQADDEFLAQTSLELIKRFTGIDNILTLPFLDVQNFYRYLSAAHNFLKFFLP